MKMVMKYLVGVCSLWAERNKNGALCRLLAETRLLTVDTNGYTMKNTSQEVPKWTIHEYYDYLVGEVDEKGVPVGDKK